MVAALVPIMVLEAVIVAQPSVPLLVDKLFFLVAMFIQMVLAVSLFLPCAPVRRKVLDACHWAFLCMLFPSVIILRALWSLLFVASLFAVAITFRRIMRNRCILTSVSEGTSVPRM